MHSMTQAMSQQQQQVDDDIAAVSFPQHLGQLPGSGVDQLTVSLSSYVCWLNNNLLYVKLLAYDDI